MEKRHTITILGSELEALRHGPSNRISWLMASQLRAATDVMRAEQKTVRNNALARWRETLPYVHEAGDKQLPDIQRAYVDTVISVQQLLDLLSDDPVKRAQAGLQIENEGGFLHDEPPELEPYFPPNGVTKYLRGDQGELNGFYTVACDPDDVKKMCAKDLGWQDGVVYTEKNLPYEVPTGEIQWTNKSKAAEMLNNLDTIALPGDLVILPRRVGRNVGWGKGLKVGTYHELDESFPRIESTVTRIFEITKVNGVPLADPVANVWSRHMNITNLGAAHIGTLTERFRRTDHVSGASVDLEVNWWLLRSRVKGLLEKAYKS